MLSRFMNNKIAKVRCECITYWITADNSDFIKLFNEMFDNSKPFMIDNHQLIAFSHENFSEEDLVNMLNENTRPLKNFVRLMGK